MFRSTSVASGQSYSLTLVLLKTYPNQRDQLTSAFSDDMILTRVTDTCHFVFSHLRVTIEPS